MPETFFHVRWPDGSQDSCYSPSSIISRYLAERPYSVSAFVDACRGGLSAASERVRQVYGGGGCSRASAQLSDIEAKADRFDETDVVQVKHIGASLCRSA